ncbi:DNA modification methylase [Microbacterium sp. W1N]|uniref:DNA modification methylase n=1 Tax=Microbacterium festucae TaxID=2977531 RepID=UPI0021C05984|nr:DNA modification methylase [Microbacterium festucae]MCT9821065.1 DNA modification methylase [Microbacterium festucae]
MKSRLIAPLALGLALTFGATGCSMVAPQATTISYSPSDGVNVPDSGPLIVRNALVIADESGEAGNLLAAVINDTDDGVTLNIGVAGDFQTLRVPARTTVSLGVDVDPLLIENLDSKPGSDVEISFQSGDGEGVATAIPVLDGTLPQYEEFVPRAGDS